MSREILFRGKSKAQGSEWLYGDVLVYENSAQIWETINNRKHNSVVALETVGQYTGLTDKNGKKIFEGDIVKETVYFGAGRERDLISVIEYGIGYAYSNVCGVCQKFRDGSGGAMLSVDKNGTAYCEVIGNIHDNPELLN